MPQSDNPTADGYYTEDDQGDDELDLSFLDDETPETNNPDTK